MLEPSHPSLFRKKLIFSVFVLEFFLYSFCDYFFRVIKSFDPRRMVFEPLKGLFLPSERISHISFLPTPGRSAMVCKRVVIGCASLKKFTNRGSCSLTIISSAYGNSTFAPCVSSL